MALVEIILAMSVMAFVSLIGMRALQGCLENIAVSRIQQVQLLQLERLRSSIEKAWDQRCSHPFQSKPWLVIKGMRSTSMTDLTSLRMRTFSGYGKGVYWELKREHDKWMIRIEHDPDTSDTHVTDVPYTGRILIEANGEVWLPGDVPEKLVWRFPDARSRDLQEGFAIWRDW